MSTPRSYWLWSNVTSNTFMDPIASKQLGVGCNLGSTDVIGSFLSSSVMLRSPFLNNFYFNDGMCSIETCFRSWVKKIKFRWELRHVILSTWLQQKTFVERLRCDLKLGSHNTGLVCLGWVFLFFILC